MFLIICVILYCNVLNIKRFVINFKVPVTPDDLPTD